MIAQWGRTTQRVVPLSRLGESSDEGGMLRLNERGLPLCFSKKENEESANLVPNRVGSGIFDAFGRAQAKTLVPFGIISCSCSAQRCS